MARRSRPRWTEVDLQDLPAGWIAHDGGPCPLEDTARPAVMFRSGSKMQLGAFPAVHWRNAIDGKSFWEWEGDRFDIVAYRLD